MRLWIPEEPGGFRKKEGSAIRAPCVSADLPLHAASRANWLLARGASLVAEQWWADDITAIDTRVYHRRSANATHLLVIALVERASAAGGTLKVTPSGGATSMLTVDDTTTSQPWQCWSVALPLVDAGLRYHTVVTSDLIVRYLAVYELVRDELDDAVDTCVALRSGSYAGIEAGRWICDGSAGSVADVLAALASAEDATKRHGGGVFFSHSAPWSMTGTVETNVADGTLGTSDFYFPFSARRIRQATTLVANEVRIEARVSGKGAGGVFKLTSTGTADIAKFSAITTAWAWHSPDAGATLDVDADGVDHLVPTGYTDNKSGVLEVASIQWLE